MRLKVVEYYITSGKKSFFPAKTFGWEGFYYNIVTLLKAFIERSFIYNIVTYKKNHL